MAGSAHRLLEEISTMTASARQKVAVLNQILHTNP
jgi:hypothetical protein